MEIKLFNNHKSEKFRKVFTEYYKGEGITLKPDTTVFDEIRSHVDSGKIKTYIIEKNNSIIAFIMFRDYTLKSDNKFLKQNFGYIMELYVVPEERNKKLATSLLNKVETDFLENKVHKIVLTSEETTYEFYKKLGYHLDSSFSCANNLKCFVKNLNKLSTN